MRYLFSLNVVATVMSFVMALVLGVVLLIYFIYMGDEPALRRDMPLLAVVTSAFAVVAVAGLATVVAQHRDQSWHWWMQGIFVVVIVATVNFCMRAFS